MNGAGSGSTAIVWDKAAGGYDAERFRDAVYHHCIHAAVAAVRRHRGRRILDVGCGTGLTTLPLLKSGRDVIATDFSFQSLARLREKTAAAHAVQADILNLPFASGSFETVLCANMLQHVSRADHQAAVHELRRLVAPGGTLVVTVHHYSREKQRAGWIKEGKPGQPGIDYIYRFSLDELQSLIPDARITAIGLSRWSRLPAWTAPYIGRLIGRYCALVGDGHMLMAVRSSR